MNLCKCGREFSNNGLYQMHLKYCNGEKINFNKIRQLYQNGFLISQIAKQCNCKKNVVKLAIKNECKRSRNEIAKIAHRDPNRKKVIDFVRSFSKTKTCDICNKTFNLGNFKRHTCINLEKHELTDEILKMYNSGKTLKEVSKFYSRSIVRKILHGKLRSISEAGKLSHKLNPEVYKFSEQTKDKIRQKRLAFLKNNPEAATAWRQKGLSYPEKLFQQLVEKYQLTKNYDIVREYTMFPYFIDFAFINIKLAIEIDGSQHWLKESCIVRDKQKDQFLLDSGWKVYRIPEFLIKNEFDKVGKDLLNYLQTFDEQPKQFLYTDQIIEYSKLRQQRKQKEELVKQQKLQDKQKQVAELQQLQINKVFNSNIDFSYFGWVRQVSELIDIWPQKVNKWMKKYMPDFYETNCFKKKYYKDY